MFSVGTKSSVGLCVASSLVGVVMDTSNTPQEELANTHTVPMIRDNLRIVWFGLIDTI
jgi:hypothetical protein